MYGLCGMREWRKGEGWLVSHKWQWDLFADDLYLYLKITFSQTSCIVSQEAVAVLFCMNNCAHVAAVMILYSHVSIIFVTSRTSQPVVAPLSIVFHLCLSPHGRCLRHCHFPQNVQQPWFLKLRFAAKQKVKNGHSSCSGSVGMVQSAWSSWHGSVTLVQSVRSSQMIQLVKCSQFGPVGLVQLVRSRQLS